MTDSDRLRAVFLEAAPPVAASRAERRAQRAEATRREALNPVRILTNVLLVPVVAGLLTVSIYIRASAFERQDALRHLVALAGCSAAVKIGLPRAAEGEPGYHARNDADGDGVACNENDPVLAVAEGAGGGDPGLYSGGAKFIRP